MRYVATIMPVHGDGTECDHRTARGGKPTQQDCTGRTSFRATCSGGNCRWDQKHPVRSVLEVLRDTHLTSHVTTGRVPAPAGHAPH
ncbi:hypothetical protein ACFV3E_36565 [Streptomyces sp. NPDC059718]